MLIRIVTVTLLIGAAPALAQAQATDQPASGAKKDNRVICEKVEQIGSRLARKRVCMTADEWAEKRRLDREDVQDAQRRLRPGS